MPGPSISNLADMFTPGFCWGRVCHVPRPIYTAGLCVLHGPRRFLLSQRHHSRLTVDQVLSQVLDRAPDDYIFQASERWSNIDLQGDPCDRVLAVWDLPRPGPARTSLLRRRDVFTFCDLRPLGRGPRFHFSHSFVLHLPTLLILFRIKIPDGFELQVEGAPNIGEELRVEASSTLIFRFVQVPFDQEGSDQPPDTDELLPDEGATDAGTDRPASSFEADSREDRDSPPSSNCCRGR